MAKITEITLKIISNNFPKAFTSFELSSNGDDLRVDNFLLFVKFQENQQLWSIILCVDFCPWQLIKCVTSSRQVETAYSITPFLFSS